MSRCVRVAGREEQALRRPISGLEHLADADQPRDRRVLDDVHEQPDHRRQEPARRLRHDHERRGVPDPAEAERRTPPRAARAGSTGPRRASPRRPARCPRGSARRWRRERLERLDRERARERLVEPRQREVDEEDRDDDRKAAPELDVARGSAICSGLKRIVISVPSTMPDQRGAEHRERGHPQRLLQARVDDVVLHGIPPRAAAFSY